MRRSDRACVDILANDRLTVSNTVLTSIGAASGCANSAGIQMGTDSAAAGMTLAVDSTRIDLGGVAGAKAIQFDGVGGLANSALISGSVLSAATPVVATNTNPLRCFNSVNGNYGTALANTTCN